MSEKVRVDTALVTRGLCQSREKARAMIMAGEVYVDKKKVLKPSEQVTEEDHLIVRNAIPVYVSRGAFKLEKAIKVFEADFERKVVLDIGASTGGFTEVSLRHGAKRVYSVDVGYGQLDWKLRNDPRVTVMERTNARYLTAEQFDERPEITVMDVSFISIQKILPVASEIMGNDGVFYTLIKPQFEAGRGLVGKKGVVRDAGVHEEVIWDIVQFVQSFSWCINHIDYSPITGPEGNIEFLAEIRPAGKSVSLEDVKETVARAHRDLKG